MTIFKKLNSKYKDRHTSVDIKNINISNDHFSSEEKILDFLLDIETYLTFPVCMNSYTAVIYDFLKKNPRIIKTYFYKYDKNTIALIFTNIDGLKQEKDFSQKISIKNNYNGYKFSIIELPINKYYDIQDGDLKLPKQWKFFEEMNKIFDKMSIF